MRESHESRIELRELVGRLGCPEAPGWFRFVVDRVGMKEVRIEDGALIHESFVPIEALIRETMDEMAASGIQPTPCGACATYKDPNRDEGIFDDPAALEGFICRACAEKMSAWTYYNDRLTV